MIRITFDFSVPYDDDGILDILESEKARAFVQSCIENAVYSLSNKHGEGVRLGEIWSRPPQVRRVKGETRERKEGGHYEDLMMQDPYTGLPTRINTIRDYMNERDE